MKHAIFYSMFILFAFILSFAGCKNNETSPVEPGNTTIQPGNDKIGNIAPQNQPAFINGNMEDGTKGFWNGGNFTGGSYTFNYADNESVSPSHSLNIVALGTSGSFAYWAQTFNASAFVGKKVAVTVNTKFSNVAGEGVMLVLRGDNTDLPSGYAEAFATTQGKVILNGTSDWKSIEVDMDPVPDGIKSLTVYMLISASNGSVYFDDLNVSATQGSGPLTDVTNGNLEAGNYSPDYWWFGSENNSIINFGWDTNEYLSPNHSVKISSQGSGNNFAVWAQTISASELLGKNITLNVHIKAVDLLGDGIYIAIRGDDSAAPTGYAEAFVTTQGHQIISGSFDWRNFSVTLDNVPANIKSLTFYLIYGKNTSGSAFFDDVSLTKE
jgi:hypothetical protein